MGQVRGKANPELQKEWLNRLQLYSNKACVRKWRLFFWNTMHFSLEPSYIVPGPKGQLCLKTSVGRNSLNLLGAVDIVSKEIIVTESTTYVTTETVVVFLEEIRKGATEMLIVIIMDNAHY